MDMPPLTPYRVAAAVFIFIIFNNCISLRSTQYIGSHHRDWRNNNATRAPYILRGDQPPPPDNDLDDGSHEEYHPFATPAYWQNQRKGHRLHPCEKSSCYPQTGNLLIGRESQLFASSTCGLRDAERYCIVSHLEERKKCFWCDSRPTVHPKPDLNHNISNIVYRVYPGTNKKTWWQSENGKENVYIQLDLEAEFHFTHIIITFKTFRPAAMLIERSYDFKKTWQVYRYFAHNCDESFRNVSKEQPHNLTDIVCESKYSNVAPSTDGEIIYRVLLPHVHIDNPYSSQVQNLMKVTNLRINFTKLHTLGDDLLDRREEIQEKYYYAITDMVVRGSCSCYGHANRCLPLPGQSSSVIDMVHGRCECTHNTKGRNCEKCEDFFNDLPWGPAVGKQTNACKRCNCNNHATSCHFDPAVYEQSGRVSGGVCDGCKHNTMGYNCEQCKEFYYMDPNRDIQDPEVCKPCDCDPHGTTDDGNCDPIGDSANSIEAGSCHCKSNVEGRRCDSCKNGFWNFSADNPLGCENCSCNTMGTVDNQGCNVYTGECTCKRYVIGRDCNQCMQEFWGLSDKHDGCQLCDCDPGGSFDNYCDVIDGQCKCREDMSGRRCNIPKQQHFTASLDFLLYEAELGKSSPNCQVVIREPSRDDNRNTWTGPGTVKIAENSYIEFTIDNIRRSMDYDVVVRYHSASGDNWDDVKMTLIRPEPIDPNGFCKDASAMDDIKYMRLPGDRIHFKVEPSLCLEEGKLYKIRLDFGQSRNGRDNSTASIQIDSILLIPRIERIPWYTGSAPAENRRRDFDANNCGFYDFEVHPREVSEKCKEHYNSIGAYILDGALKCQCDPTGSVSKLCEEYGGNCECKPNVVGRRCDRCAVGTFGFGPEGCMACDCNNIGALHNFCNSTTGQCACRANTYGRQCDQCRTGFWNFPNCQRCDCNGHADICDSRAGTCIDCRDNSEGPTCDRCVDGFYGDPRLNVDIPCRSCPCPGIPGSGHSYADRCSMDTYTKDVICECQEGYAGARCDVCADNYYGNPEEPGGSCQPCECSNKIDQLKPGNCDSKTGQCKQCLYNTTGDHCEKCRPGFYREYDADICTECRCFVLGTNSSIGHCDYDSGQCPCFPNVNGKSCDVCAPNHWKIASGAGCEACGCDPVGSIESQCHPYEGQCACRPNFGGRQCNECKTEYWGNPKQNECHKCECDRYGTYNFQCDRKTGACVCRPGIGGYNCDKCARGYIGDAPNCSPCGECFDNWDRILHEHENNTKIEIERAKTIKTVGATGAYTKEFDEMQQKLNEIESLLNSTDTIDLKSIDGASEELQERIKDIKDGPLKELSDNLANVDRSNKLGEHKLKVLENNLQRLVNQTKELQNNGTLLREGNVQGALTLIEQAKQKADRAAQKAEYSHRDVEYAERQCKAIDNLIQTTQDDWNQNHDEQNDALREIGDNVDNLTSIMPDLNNLVCDRQGDPCDAICGGAGCAVCGAAVSCENGAKQLAEMALHFANETEDILKKKEDQANEFIRNVNAVNTTLSKQTAQEAWNAANAAWIKSNETLSKLAWTKKDINDFLNSNITKTEDIDARIQEVLDKSITLDKEEIKSLAEKIKKAVQAQENIEGIIADTADDLDRAEQLKSAADALRTRVDLIQNTTIGVRAALDNSTSEQKTADGAIKTARESVNEVEELLNLVHSEYDDAKRDINETDVAITKLQDEIKNLQYNVSNNEHTASTFMDKSKSIEREAKETRKNLDDLHQQYNTTANALQESINKVKASEDKANYLVNRAVELTAKINTITEDLQKIQSNNPDDTLNKLEHEIDELNKRMGLYNDAIQTKLEYYKTCS